MTEVGLAEFRKMVSNYSGLETGSDFVDAAILHEAEEYGPLRRDRVQAVGDNARERAGNFIPSAKRRENDSQPRGPASGPDAALLSKAFAKRLGPWASELREEGFGIPDSLETWQLRRTGSSKRARQIESGGFRMIHPASMPIRK
jgi:hypothetical protein